MQANELSVQASLQCTVLRRQGQYSNCMESYYMADKDLKPEEFPVFTWESASAENSLAEVYKYTTGRATASCNWYLDRKWYKRWCGYLLRIAALFSVTVAGLVPLFGEIFVSNGKPCIHPLWSGVALAVAALAVALDKLGGLTSGWVRYVITAQQIGQLLERFRFDWEAAKVKRTSPPKPAEILEALTLCSTFLEAVHKAVQDETNRWAEEFRVVLSEIEKAAKSAADLKRPGGLNLTVTNGDSAANGWTLSVNGGAPRTCTGKSATLIDLQPGLCQLKASGDINGKTLTAERTLTIQPGAASDLTLTLE